MSDEVKDVVVNVAQKYLNWWKFTSDGKNINGPCPFHHETTEGAFYISTVHGAFLCHGCHAKGSLYTFLKEIGAPSRYRHDVMDMVASHLFTKAKKGLVNYHKDPFAGHMPLNEGLLGAFDYCPIDLVRAGFDEEVLKKYEIGFDKEAMRITFPIRNHLGVLMGVAGRTVTGEHPRYKIYIEKDLLRFSEKYKGYHFEKKNFLWNMDRVYNEAFHGDLNHIFVVEGYKAALWLIQHGAWNTVALMGTYLSSMQQRLLSRMDAEVILFLDNTEGAEKGVYEAGKLLRKSNSIRVCIYPEDRERGTQPDDLSTEELQQTLVQTESFFQWRKSYEFLRSKKTRSSQRPDTFSQ